ncbi:hypothetical protein [Limibacterium fermenti]|jgi:hypothetical protein|uniref:hypothetical protein n=1 Tax=Limibacterium fermenti TaxID=3229863 RepID=UPI0026C717E6
MRLENGRSPRTVRIVDVAHLPDFVSGKLTGKQFRVKRQLESLGLKERGKYEMTNET